MNNIRTIIIKGGRYEISAERIRQIAGDYAPDSIRDYYVEVEGKQFPPKQLIRLATGTRDPFNSQNARSVLTKLGFSVKARTVIRLDVKYNVEEIQ